METLSWNIKDLLLQAYEKKASDLHITAGVPPVFRMNGRLEHYGTEVVTPEMIDTMIREILPDFKVAEFDEKGETDFNYTLEGYCRFRVNAYHQRNAGAIAARLISSKIPTIDSLNMPKVLYELAEKPQGLILVTGPTGSGNQPHWRR